MLSLKSAVAEKFRVHRGEKIPGIVRLIENPVSPLALPGKINLFNHDCLHILLGQDTSLDGEAFLIGFCMGSDKRTRRIHLMVFQLVSRFLYPTMYRFKPQHFVYFDAGFCYGRSLNRRSINLIDFNRVEIGSVDNIREYLGIDLHCVLRVKQEYIRRKYLNTGLMVNNNSNRRYSIKFLRISSGICAIIGGVMLASNSAVSPYGFIGLAASSSQLLISSILDKDLILAVNSGSIFLFVDLLGIYRWLLIN